MTTKWTCPVTIHGRSGSHRVIVEFPSWDETEQGQLLRAAPALLAALKTFSWNGAGECWCVSDGRQARSDENHSTACAQARAAIAAAAPSSVGQAPPAGADQHPQGASNPTRSPLAGFALNLPPELP